MLHQPELHLAGTYRRTVAASLERVWENVFDWEHLAHLHDGSFARCDLLARGPWGWRATLALTGGHDNEQVIELRADREAGRYVTTTLSGAGAGSEIRVALAPRAAHSVDVVVEFHLPERDPGRLAALGQGYAAAYARLWDEDEAMMGERERALARRAARGSEPAPGPVDLGSEAEVRAALPLDLALGGERFRLIELDGALVAHALTCPHWLGPLDRAAVDADGAVRCPWHGYRFDVRSGACLGRPQLRLATAPAIRIVDGRVLAVPA